MRLLQLQAFSPWGLKRLHLYRKWSLSLSRAIDILPPACTRWEIGFRFTPIQTKCDGLCATEPDLKTLATRCCQVFWGKIAPDVVWQLLPMVQTQRMTMEPAPPTHHNLECVLQGFGSISWATILPFQAKITFFRSLTLWLKAWDFHWWRPWIFESSAENLSCIVCACTGAIFGSSSLLVQSSIFLVREAVIFVHFSDPVQVGRFMPLFRQG